MAEGGTKSTHCCGNSAGDASASLGTLHFGLCLTHRINQRPWQNQDHVDFMTIPNALLSVPPDILDDMSSSDTLATEGMRVVLNCHAEGNPSPAIVWRREDGKKIRVCSNLSGRTKECKEDLVHYGSHLELSHISRFDSGVYLCIANNGVPPPVSKRVRLYVDCKNIKIPFWLISPRSSFFSLPCSSPNFVDKSSTDWSGVGSNCGT